MRESPLDRPMRRVLQQHYRRWGKRSFDLLISVALIIALFPVFVILMLVVRTQLGKPVFFLQTRAGRRGQPFTLYKFRSMLDLCDDRGEPLPDAVRITKLGRFLRASSLDELPQLWNVLRGDMSLIGPRPLLLRYVPRYSPKQARRLDVRPGISGWAQVRGRNALTWERKFEFDVEYVEKYALMMDLKIAWLTVARLLSPKDINSQGDSTMPEFLGSQR